MPYRTRQELEAENLVLLGKLESMRDELADFLDDEAIDEDSEDFDPPEDDGDDEEDVDD